MAEVVLIRFLNQAPHMTRKLMGLLNCQLTVN